MPDEKNILWAVVLSIGILLGYHYFFPSDHRKNFPEQPRVASPHQPIIASALSRKAPLNILPEQRVKIETQNLQGSFSLRGTRFDDLRLKAYHQTPDPQSEIITLLTSQEALTPYYAEFGWTSPHGTLKVPTAETCWVAEENQTLSVDHPVVLTWNNGEGLIFERRIEIDAQYLLTITDTVINSGDTAVSLAAYGSLTRRGLLKTSDFFILHEGAVGVWNNKLQEVSYKKLLDTPLHQHMDQGGWLGFTDKYWLTALIPQQSMAAEVRYHAGIQEDRPYYQVDYVGQPLEIHPGKTGVYQSSFFAGPKILALLDAYEAKLGIKKFDLAIDFGWFYFLTKPIFNILTYFHKLLGNFGYSILLLTILMKLLFFPLANKSYRAMSRMKKLQPEMERLKVIYGEDRIKMNQALMEIYKKQKVNPMAGCLPMIVQIPVFFALYKVLFVTIEMRHAPFIGWIYDLSAPDPTTVFNLFGLLPWTPPTFLMIGVWPLLMGVTMVLQQRLNPQPADPLQQKMFMLIPIMFTFMLAQFPVGLVIYWAWSNVLSIIQQWMIMRLEAQRNTR